MPKISPGIAPNCAFASAGLSLAASSSPPALTNLTGTTIIPVPISGWWGVEPHPTTRAASASSAISEWSFDISEVARAGYGCFAGGLCGIASMYTD